MAEWPHSQSWRSHSANEGESKSRSRSVERTGAVDVVRASAEPLDRSRFSVSPHWPDFQSAAISRNIVCIRAAIAYCIHGLRRPALFEAWKILNGIRFQ